MMFRDMQYRLVEKPAGKPTGKRTSVYGMYSDRGMVLVVKPSWNDLWELPGGEVESGESFSDALAREFLEETGYTVSGIGNAPFLSMKRGFYINHLDEYFDSELHFLKVSGIGNHDPKKIIGSEIREVGFKALPGLDEETCHPLSLEALKFLRP